MEILQPEAPQEPKAPVEPTPTVEQTKNLKQIQILQSLGLKDQLFNEDIMEKVDYIAERVALDEFDDLFVRVGNDFTPKIDKIHQILQLREMDKDLEKKKNLIKEQLKQYE